MSELRWTLLIIGVAFIAGLAFWERRRGRQAAHPGATPRAASREVPADVAALSRREPGLVLPTLRARDPIIGSELPVLEASRELPADDRASPPAGWVNEPAVPAMYAEAQPPSAGAASDAAVAPADEAIPANVRLESLPRLPPAAAPRVEWPPGERRHVVTLRLVATQPERFAGRSLRQALAAEGFVLGPFAIFHKPDEEQRAVLSAASLTTPGTFDEETMDSQHYGGLSLFAVLPGPKAPPETFDELILTARSLSDRLCGMLQDEQGSPLTPARIALLRERLAAGASA